MQVENSRPAILCFAGLDPSGGAGLQADIEAIASCGGHALPIATCLTVQNTSQAIDLQPVNAELVQRQAEALQADIPIAGCKIGVLPNSDIVCAVADFLSGIPDVPVVLDPVLHAAQGIGFCDQSTVNIIKQRLLPKVRIITPNQAELKKLTSENATESENSRALCASGSAFVFVTSADQEGNSIKNTLYNNEGIVHQNCWSKLPHSYHGSGCTLSSAICYFIASGLDVVSAVNKAEQYTRQCLIQADVIGAGQYIPRRI